MLDACRTNYTCFYCKGESDPGNKSHGKISYPNTILPDGRVILEEYAIRRDFVEEVLSNNGFKNLKACYDEWNAMGVLDRDKDRPTRSRKINPKSNKTEDVFVLRVFGDPPIPTPSKSKSKLIKRSIPKPSTQLTALLSNKEDEDND